MTETTCSLHLVFVSDTPTNMTLVATPQYLKAIYIEFPLQAPLSQVVYFPLMMAKWLMETRHKAELTTAFIIHEDCKWLSCDKPITSITA